METETNNAPDIISTSISETGIICDFFNHFFALLWLLSDRDFDDDFVKGEVVRIVARVQCYSRFLVGTLQHLQRCGESGACCRLVVLMDTYGNNADQIDKLVQELFVQNALIHEFNIFRRQEMLEICREITALIYGEGRLEELHRSAYGS